MEEPIYCQCEIRPQDFPQPVAPQAAALEMVETTGLSDWVVNLRPE